MQTSRDGRAGGGQLIPPSRAGQAERAGPGKSIVSRPPARPVGPKALPRGAWGAGALPRVGYGTLPINEILDPCGFIDLLKDSSG